MKNMWVTARTPPSVHGKDQMSDRVLVTNGVLVMAGMYKKWVNKGAWNLVLPKGGYTGVDRVGITITHWMPMPEMPK